MMFVFSCTCVYNKFEDVTQNHVERNLIMERLNQKTVVSKGGKKTLKEVLDAVLFMSATAILEFFEALEMNLPRKLRIDALKEVLNPRIEKEKKALEISVQASDNPNRLRDYRRLERLEYFDFFSENEYIEELERTEEKDVIHAYLQHLWANILEHLYALPLEKHTFAELEKKAKDNRNPAIVSDISAYDDALDKVFCDAPGEIDGLTPDQFRSILSRAATINELVKLGKKFNVKVPRYLKKGELRDMIFTELEKRGELDENLRETMMKFTVDELEEYAATHGIMAKTYFNKEMVVEYILQNAETTSEKYCAPPVKPPVEAEPPEERPVKEEPIEEQTVEEEPIEKEPVEEETIEEEPPVEDEEPDEEAEPSDLERIEEMARRDLVNAKCACRRLLLNGLMTVGGVLIFIAAIVVVVWLLFL